VHNPQEEGEMMHDNAKTGAQQRELRFEDDEIWVKLPGAVQERCLTLWKELLASVLNEGKRRPDERED
jgi:hypothetical protein